MATYNFNTLPNFDGDLPTANKEITECHAEYTSTQSGNTYTDYMSISTTYGTYKVGRLTFFNNGPNYVVAKVSDGVTTETETIFSGTNKMVYINYNSGRVDIYIDIPSYTGSATGTLDIRWEGLDRELTSPTNYTVSNVTYNGSSQDGVTVISHCTKNSNPQTSVGNYSSTLTAENGTQTFMDIWYFNENNTPKSSINVSWSIVKAEQTWTANDIDLSNYSVDNQQININGSYYGALSYYVYSGDNLITLDTNYTPAYVYRNTWKGGTAGISISTPGDNNHNARTQSISVYTGDITKPIKIYTVSGWANAVPYIYNGTDWVPATAYVYTNSGWKETKE